MLEKAFLIGCLKPRQRRTEALDSLSELAELARSAEAEVVGETLSDLREPTPTFLIGRGKVDEIRDLIKSKSIDLVLFDEELTPAQNQNLEEAWGCKVIDRTGLILDIFARRARTREGKIQVEMAQLSYLLPRLIGKGEQLSRLGGGIGTRGPGETKLEMDRRRAKEKMHRLAQDLKKVKLTRQGHRGKREKVPIPLVSLVGYTNAGKSTLMNRLTEADVLVEDKLFATLDPTVRRLSLPSGREVLLSDTVGFIKKLPHELIESFKATFEEIESSDLLLHLIDGSNPHWEDQKEAVDEVLENLGLSSKPCLTLFNKADLSEEQTGRFVEGLAISAKEGSGMKELLGLIEQELARGLTPVRFLFPHSAGRFLSLLYREARVLSVKHLKKGIQVQAEVGDKALKQFHSYRT
ncbi:MAG: GTPase HflX [Deltaproteobacteria bacterium]|nr:GTPase HflX [Deltaproteobacteria bacterium]